MKSRLTFLAIVLAILALFVCIGMPNTGCTQDELASFSSAHPNKTVIATTQAIEKGEEVADKGAAKAKDAVDKARGISDGATAIGIPYASAVGVVLTGISGLLGTYIERRRNTIPLRTAITQVVQSVEAAFPSKSDAQKSALAQVQDSATKNLVTQIKGT